MIGVKLKGKKEMSLTSPLERFEDVEKIYVPLEQGKVLVKPGQKVFVGEKVVQTKSGRYLFSSISGKVESPVMMRDKNNQRKKYLVVKNDFQDAKKREYDNENFDRFTKESFIDSLIENGIVGLGGDGFLSYLKYQGNINDFIINAVECEPYVTCDEMTTLYHVEEILKTIDCIMKLFSIETSYIVVKKKSFKLRELLITSTINYSHIKIIDIPNLYPLGWEKTLVRYIKHVDYEKTPLEKEILVHNISTVYAIYEALRYQKPLYERVVTFSGEGIKYPKNYIVRIGTKVEDILDQVGLTGNPFEFSLIAGGPMMGNAIQDDQLIIDATCHSILVLPALKEKESTCIHCGKCVNNCPVKLCPVLIYEYQKQKKSLKRLHPSRCIECGICSYLCPANINLREVVKQAKEKEEK